MGLIMKTPGTIRSGPPRTRGRNRRMLHVSKDVSTIQDGCDNPNQSASLPATYKPELGSIRTLESFPAYLFDLEQTKSSAPAQVEVERSSKLSMKSLYVVLRRCDDNVKTSTELGTLSGMRRITCSKPTTNPIESLSFTASRTILEHAIKSLFRRREGHIKSPLYKSSSSHFFFCIVRCKCGSCIKKRVQVTHSTFKKCYSKSGLPMVQLRTCDNCLKPGAVYGLRSAGSTIDADLRMIHHKSSVSENRRQNQLLLGSQLPIIKMSRCDDFSATKPYTVSNNESVFGKLEDKKFLLLLGGQLPVIKLNHCDKLQALRPSYTSNRNESNSGKLENTKPQLLLLGGKLPVIKLSHCDKLQALRPSLTSNKNKRDAANLKDMKSRLLMDSLVPVLKLKRCDDLQGPKEED